jgi:hypothetical protein
MLGLVSDPFLLPILEAILLTLVVRVWWYCSVSPYCEYPGIVSQDAALTVLDIMTSTLGFH